MQRVMRRSIVAMRAFHALVALLRLEAERGDGARFEATDADRLVRLLAIAVAPVLDAQQRRVDLGDELALAIARPELDRALGLVIRDRKGLAAQLQVERREARIWGDPNLLRQVFENLIVNAAQAMAMEGTLTVKVRTAEVDGVEGVAVDIIDTGEGMDTQVRLRARDPFFTTRPSGTGLGLAIVDRIVGAHGGHLGIDSRAGEGTTVTVFLPARSADEPALLGRSSKAPAQAPGAPESA